MVDTHLAGLWGNLGANREKFLQLGHFDRGEGPQFNMTALALRSAGSVNGVSQLHGEVTKQMWPRFGRNPADKLPVKFVTNGVHVPTWLSADMASCWRGTWAMRGWIATTIQRCATAC